MKPAGPELGRGRNYWEDYTYWDSRPIRTSDKKKYLGKWVC